MRKGMTLLETLFTLAVLTILMGTLSTLLLAGKSNWLVARAVRQTRQSLNDVLEERLARELHASSAGSLTVGSGCFSFLSARGLTQSLVTDGSGLPIWQAYVVYSLDPGSGRLYRRTAPAGVGPLSSAQLQSLAGRSGGQQLAEGLSRLELSRATGSRLVVLTLTARAQGSTGKWTELSRQLSVVMWN